MPEYLVNWSCAMTGSTTVRADSAAEAREMIEARSFGSLADDADSPTIDVDSVEDISGPDGCSEAKSRRENKR